MKSLVITLFTFLATLSTHTPAFADEGNDIVPSWFDFAGQYQTLRIDGEDVCPKPHVCLTEISEVACEGKKDCPFLIFHLYKNHLASQHIEIYPNGNFGTNADILEYSSPANPLPTIGDGHVKLALTWTKDLEQIEIKSTRYLFTGEVQSHYVLKRFR